MWFKLNDEQAAIYARLKGPSVSRNYDIRKALADGKPLPSKPGLRFRMIHGPCYGSDDLGPCTAIMGKYYG